MCWYHSKFGDKAKKCHAPCLSAAIKEVAQSRRLFVTDKNNNIRFLVDSGADISVLPYSKCGKRLKPANRNSDVWRKTAKFGPQLAPSLPLAFRYCRCVYASTRRSFFSQFGLLVDIRDA
ncbi:hypothetical protein Trydic_g6785 [Trypoxylus dichotomus]